MKELTIKFDYSDLTEVVSDINKSLVLKFKNGDRITMPKNEESTRLRKHLIKNFNGEHLG